MRRLLYTSILLATLLVGCGDNKQNDTPGHADMMYAELKALMRSHCDSLRLASDSASIAHSIERYETELNKCIFRHPAGTDLELSAGQQDTLTMLTENFLALKRSKIQGLTMPADSVASDSVTQNKHDAN